MSTKEANEKENICKNCRWFDTDVEMEGYLGQCRRMPPTAKDNLGRQWPKAFDDDWCGEFKLDVDRVIEGGCMIVLIATIEQPYQDLRVVEVCKKNEISDRKK